MSEVIGVISGILGIISFAQDNFPAADSPSTKVRFVVGLDGTEGLSNAGGDVPDVRLFNENLGFLGIAADPGYVDSGSFYDVTVSQDNTQQPTFGLFTGNTDAVCIAYISSTWPDDQKYGWVGNWGRQCGKSWYYSNIYLDGNNLDCTWLDSNGDATDVTAFHVHFPEFNDKGEGYNSDVNYYCNNVRTLNWQYTEDPNTIYVKRSEGAMGDNVSLPMKKRGHYVDNRLVKSSVPAHSAVELCASETSVGPDFISLAENTYCNMETRQVHPLCTGPAQTECFDADTLAIRAANGKRSVAKSFGKILSWDGEKH